MNKKRIKGGARLRDVAMAAGVSNATVSAVANGKADQYGICRATQDKVQAAIRQLGYSPSLAALDMVSGRNSLVGLAIAADFPAANHRMAALESLLAQAGFRVILVSLPPDPPVATARLTSLLRFGVAGLVICPVGSIALPKLTCPAIMVGGEGGGCPAVYEDEQDGGRRLARRLLDKGHRRIAILGGTATQSPVGVGFLEACAQVGATVRSFNSAAEFLPTAETMTAVFCVTPAVLLELYSRGFAAGLRLGTDLAVVAVDTLGVATNLVPRPTVLQPGIARLGQAVVQLLQQLIQGATPGDIRLEPVISDGDQITPFSQSIPVSPPPVMAPKLATVPPQKAPSPVITPSIHKPVILPSETFQIPETAVSTPAIPASAVVAAVPGGTALESPTPVPEPIPMEGGAPSPPDPETAIPVPVAVIEPVPPPSTPEPPIIAPTPETPAPVPEPVIPVPVAVIEPVPPPPTPEPPIIAPTPETPSPVSEPVIPVPAAVIEPVPPLPTLEPAIIAATPETPPFSVSTPDDASSPSSTPAVAPDSPTSSLPAP